MFTDEDVLNHPALGMLEELDLYYRKQGISAVSFNCENRSECSVGCKPNDFVTTREAFVGSEYEKCTLPRLLFVSLDAGDEYPGREPEQRTLQAMRTEEEVGCNPNRLPKGKHWYETHALAHQFLEPIARARLGRSVPFEEIHRYFAHTNSAKCKNLAMGTREGIAVLFKNCRRFIAGEVEILCPDILVTQGRWAREAVSAAFPVLRQEQMPDHPEYGYEIIDLADREVIKFNTAHQRAFGRFWREKKVAYPWYAQAAVDFLLK